MSAGLAMRRVPKWNPIALNGGSQPGLRCGERISAFEDLPIAEGIIVAMRGKAKYRSVAADVEGWRPGSPPADRNGMVRGSYLWRFLINASEHLVREK